MPLTPLDEALAAWGKPALRVRIVKQGLTPYYPPPAEADAMRPTLERSGVPEDEWPMVAAVAERIRISHTDLALRAEAEAQVAVAQRFLGLTERDFLRWPWAALDGVMGGMAPGTLHFVVCPSKGGKTTLCRSATAKWLADGRRVYYGGFEMKADTLRMMNAADDAGLDPGDVLSGEWLRFSHYSDLVPRLTAALKLQDDPTGPYSRLRFSPFERVDRAAVTTMMQQAHDWGADCVVVDHIDHVDGGSDRTRGAYEVAVATSHLFLSLAQRHGLRLLITSQTNRDGRSADRFRDHRPVRDTSVKMGDTKLEVATTMLGFYRPLKPGFTKEERQQVEAGERDLPTVLWPGVSAFNVMAHRNYGSRLGVRGLLGWDRGRTVDPPLDAEAATHGIRTNRDI